MIDLFLIPNWFWHPLGTCGHDVACRGYNFWSGIEGALPQVAALGLIVTAIFKVRTFAHRHFQCHEETCRKLGVHRVNGTPYRTCWHHHPVLSGHVHRKVSLEEIHRAHREAQKDG